MHDDVLVSVVTPVYNSRRFLKTAIESILCQTHRNLEFLLFDDGSTDGSIDVIRRYEQEDARVRGFLRTHSGYCVHLNEGIRVAKGKYIARFDSDDISDPGRLEYQVDFLERNLEVGAVASALILIDEGGLPFGRQGGSLRRHEIDERHIQGDSGVFPHPSVMMRTDLVRRVGGYRCQFEPAEDLDLWLRLAELSGLAVLQEELLSYRVHSGMTSVTRAELQRRKVVEILREARQRRGLPLAECKSIQEHGVVGGRKRLSDETARMDKALINGFFETAEVYARRILLKRPWSISCWYRYARCKWARYRRSGRD